MSKQKVLVSSIGKNVLTPEERNRKNYERHILLRIGVIPPYFTGNDNSMSIDDLKNKKGRFSTNYATYEEFIHDRTIVFELVTNGKHAPEELVSKVEHTVKELNLQDL